VWFLRRSKRSDESIQALKDAQRNLVKVQRRGNEVTKIAKALKDIRERNHFAEQLEEIVIRRKGSLS
jgi:hypothetical protein